MSYTYEQGKKQNSEKSGSKPLGSERNPSFLPSFLPNSAQLSQMGHQVGMPEVMREKMEGAFGMDLSGVKLYENRAVSDAGAEAVTQGSRIAFAPGKLDFSSTRGQELLGHEISHVASQARGEVRGSGLVNDSALEARADKEGFKAARGERIAEGYGGAIAPLSNASAASAAGPMQAKSGQRDADAENVKKMQKSGLNYNSIYATSDMEGYDDLSADEWETKRHAPSLFKRLFGGQKTINYKKRRTRLPSSLMPIDAASEENYNLLNTQQGTDEERFDAYVNLAEKVKENTTGEEQTELAKYSAESEATNRLLRGDKKSILYPKEKKYKDEALRTSKFVSSAIEKNRIQKAMNVFRGIPDSKLGEILTQKGLIQAVKSDGGLDYQWIKDHLREVQDAVINTTFADNGFTSTTTEKRFAQYWGQKKNQSENFMRLAQIPDKDKTEEQKNEFMRWATANPKENNVPGGHIINMSLPAGSRAALISAAAKDKDGDFLKQQEVLVDKGSLFKITGFDVNKDEGAGPDSFNLMMELLSDEENM